MSGAELGETKVVISHGLWSSNLTYWGQNGPTGKDKDTCIQADDPSLTLRPRV